MCEAFGFQHSEVMRMPFITFQAYNRLAIVRNVNRSRRKKFDEFLGG